MFSTMPMQRHLHLLEHRDAAPGVDQRQVLRRRDDHRPRQGHVLGHRKLGVAGAWRHVDDQDVEFAPVDLAQKLGQGRHHHRPAPDHRRAFFDEEADRHHLDAIGLERGELVPVGCEVGFGGDPEQSRHRGPEQVRVEHADLEAELREADREIAGDCRLADAAFAGRDSDDVLDAGNGRTRSAAVAG